jgi:hypothetical protein
VSKVLHIFTGSPGSGKLVHVYNTPELRGLPIYCCYHFNKRFWPNATQTTVLCAYSPRRQMKEHWLDQARAEGFEPKLYVLKTPKGECYERMTHRPKNNHLTAEIEDWFRNYTPHVAEILVTVPKYNEKAERGIYSG